MKKLLVFLIAMTFAQVARAQKPTFTYDVRQPRRGTGLRHSLRSQEFLKNASKVSFSRVDEAIPGNVDLSPLVSPPENQGSCGSCWAFSLTKALRSAWMVAGKDPGQLEFNYLLNNCGPGPKMWGCGGGYFDAADSFIDPAGPGLNKDNPYNQRQGNCKNLPVAATTVSYKMLGEEGKGPTFKDLAYAVGVMKQALSIDVSAGGGYWSSYTGGIYNGCNFGQIDHMVNMVGYSCEKSVDEKGNCVFDDKGEPAKKDGYLLVQNNWGTSWGTKAASGQGGYMKTRYRDSRGRRCNQVANDALMFTVSE